MRIGELKIKGGVRMGVLLTRVHRPAYNFTGSHAMIYTTGVLPSQEFDITPNAVSAVA